VSQLWDPLSGYLPETQDFLNLCDFIAPKTDLSSKVGPEFDQLPLSYKISLSLAEVVSSFESLSESEEIVIGLAVARFWFNKMAPEHKYCINARFVTYISNLSLLPVRNLTNLFEFEGNSAKFLQSVPILAGIVDKLFECMFATVPDDVAHIISGIELRFAGFSASKLKKDLDDDEIWEMVSVLWRLAVIGSGIGVIDGVLGLVEEHLKLNVFHGPIFRNCGRVLGVVKKLVEESELI
jgi:hypothetical protein